MHKPLPSFVWYAQTISGSQQHSKKTKGKYAKINNQQEYHLILAWVYSSYIHGLLGSSNSSGKKSGNAITFSCIELGTYKYTNFTLSPLLIN